MSELRAELTDANELNQKLQQDIEIYSQDQQKVKQLDEYIQKLTKSLTAAKDKIHTKDLQIQEARFKNKDADSRVKELEAKNAFQMTQIEQLKTDNVRFEEELNLTRQENTNETAHADTYKANLKDKLLNLQQENKLLKSQLETKFNEEKFSAEQ